MRRALLDVNVLLALLDAGHVHHGQAREWLEANVAAGWASCAITENGFVRVISQPGYARPKSPAEAITALRRARDEARHEFWPCEVSLLDERTIDRSRVLGLRQVTDVYLLALAVAHGGRLVTFDRSVSLAAVPGAKEDNLTVV